MDRIAFINGESFLYWSQILLALGAVAAIAIYASVYLGKSRNYFALCVSTALTIAISIPLSRLIHWYCRTAAYESMEIAMTDYTVGGYALMGVFAAALLAAGICRLLRISKSMGQMLDAMSIGGGIGIGVGRLACLFNSADRGMILPDTVGLPWAWPVTNAVSGEIENRLAVFMIQAMLVAGIVLILLAYMAWRKLRKKPTKSGDIFLMFLLMYCCSQAVCDSTRYDALFFRSNGFVSMVQIFSLLALLVPIVLFSIRMVKRFTLRWWQFPIWVGIAGMLGMAGYMEYYVQRHGDLAAMCYTVMGSCMTGVAVTGLVIRFLSELRKKSADTGNEISQATTEDVTEQEAPAEEIAEDVAAQEIPAEEVPAEEAPAEEAAEEAPAVEAAEEAPANSEEE